MAPCRESQCQTPMAPYLLSSSYQFHLNVWINLVSGDSEFQIINILPVSRPSVAHRVTHRLRQRIQSQLRATTLPSARGKGVINSLPALRLHATTWESNGCFYLLRLLVPISGVAAKEPLEMNAVWAGVWARIHSELEKYGQSAYSLPILLTLHLTHFISRLHPIYDENVIFCLVTASFCSLHLFCSLPGFYSNAVHWCPTISESQWNGKWPSLLLFGSC